MKKNDSARWSGQAWLGRLALLVVLGATVVRYLEAFFSEARLVGHFEGFMVPAMRELDAGNWMIRGPEFSDFGLFVGGPLYFWLHLPARLWSNPMVGLYSTYALWECLALLLFVRWARPPNGWCAGQAGTIRTWIVLTAALFVGLYPEAKLQITENTNLAITLCTALFGALLWAGRRGRSYAMVLPGVLWGLAIQVHPLALLLAPAIGLHLLADGRVGLRRLGLLLLGVAAVTAPMLWFVQTESETRTADAVGDLLRQLDLRGILDWLRRSVLLDPWPLAGMVLLALRRWRGDRLDPGLRLALLWFLLYPSALTVALVRRVPIGLEIRFGLANPARGLLSGVAAVRAAEGLVLLAQAVVRRVSRRASAPESGGGRTVQSEGDGPKPAVRGRVAWAVSLLLLVAGGGVLGATAWRAMAAVRVDRAAAVVEQQAPGPQQVCDCRQLRGLSDLRRLARRVDEISAVGWPAGQPGDNGLLGPGHRLLDPVHYWTRSAGIRGVLAADPPATPRQWVLITPRMPGVDLRQVPGVVDHHSFLMVPGWRRLLHQVEDDDRQLTVALPADAPPNATVALVLNTRNAEEDLADVQLWRGGRRLIARSRCPCWGCEYKYLILLYKLESGGAPELDLRGKKAETRFYLDLLLSPVPVFQEPIRR